MTFLYLLRNADGLYYSPRSKKGWNRSGKFLTRQQLAAVPSVIKEQAATVEKWIANHYCDLSESPI